MPTEGCKCLTMSRLGLKVCCECTAFTLSERRHGECPGAIALPRSILNSCFCTHSSPFPAPEHRTGNLVPLCTAKFGSQIETLSTSWHKTAKEIASFGHVLLSGSLGKLASERACGSAMGIAHSPSCPPISKRHQLVTSSPEVVVDRLRNISGENPFSDL